MAVKVQGLTDKLLINGSFACMTEGGTPYGLLSDGALVIKSGKIDWLGPNSELPAEYQDYSVEDLEGRLVTPGFIDCHTHLVFGGNRAREFELRLQGASYEEIARQGGGIVSTVRHTRAMSEAELVDATLPRLDALLAEGITTIEIKSGYGLSIEDELKMLRAARTLEAKRHVRIKTTFLRQNTKIGQMITLQKFVCLPLIWAWRKGWLMPLMLFVRASDLPLNRLSGCLSEPANTVFR